MYRFSRFSYFANRVARLIAHPFAFLIVLLLVFVWLLTGPLVGFNSLWQAAFSSSTAVVTFLLLFLIQHTQAREMAAVQLKLNELIRASEGTHNALLDIEQLTDRDYDQIRENYALLAHQAREQLKDGKLRWATARIQMESLESLLDPTTINIDAAIQESTRIDAVLRSGLLDKPIEGVFDRLTRVAAKAVNVPVVLLSLVGEDHEWFASAVGLKEPYCSERQAPLSHSFCKHVVALKKPLVITDAREHPLVKGSPAILDLGIIAYAGIPLITTDNQVLGSFCAIDHKPRHWTDSELSILQDLCEVAIQEIQNMSGNSLGANGSLSGLSFANPHPYVSAAQDSDAGPSGATILIVDDSATNRKLLSHRLESAGYSVVVSPTGREALDYVRTKRVDLILLDIMLPDLDGERILQMLQSDGVLKQIPVIMISALDEQESIRRCLEMGARDYLLKPFDSQKLQACICAHLPGSQLAASLPDAVIE